MLAAVRWPPRSIQALVEHTKIAAMMQHCENDDSVLGHLVINGVREFACRRTAKLSLCMRKLSGFLKNPVQKGFNPGYESLLEEISVLRIPVRGSREIPFGFRADNKLHL
jgi:hypothetical protein